MIFDIETDFKNLIFAPFDVAAKLGKAFKDTTNNWGGWPIFYIF